MKGDRCGPPWNRHTVYRWIDFRQSNYERRTQGDIDACAHHAENSGTTVYGVHGKSPISKIMSIPLQSTLDYFHLTLEIHFR